MAYDIVPPDIPGTLFVVIVVPWWSQRRYTAVQVRSSSSSAAVIEAYSVAVSSWDVVSIVRRDDALLPGTTPSTTANMYVRGCTVPA